MAQHKVYALPNACTPSTPVTFDPEICNGCNQCVDICQVDLARNGFTWSRQISDMAESHGLKVVNHFYSTPINLAAGLHWLVSRKSAFIFEYCIEDNPIRRKIAKPDIPVIDGYITVPDGPGLGIELDEKAIDRYRVR